MRGRASGASLLSRMPRSAEPAAPAPHPRPAREAALSRIRLRHLQCFLAVAQFGNLGRAAEALATTQPAVTKTINELEALLGQPLFVRGRHGATPTFEAEAFMRHASASVNALGHAVDSVLRLPDATPLRLGVLPTVAAAFLPSVLRRFAERWLQVVVRIETGRNAELVAMLRRRELDAVVGRVSEPELMAGPSFEPLYAEPLVVVARPGHALAPEAGRRGKSAPVLARIGACPMVLAPIGTLIRQVADAFLRRHGVSPEAGLVETLDTAFARALVLHGDHLWFTPRGAAEADIESGALVRLALDLTPDKAVGLLLRTEPLLSDTLQTFVAAVRAGAAARVMPRRRSAAFR